MKKNFSRLKILITGADGFIGSHLVDRLLDLNAKVFCVVEPDSDMHRIIEMKDKIHVLRYDICGAGLKKEIKKINPEKIFHLAAFVTPKREELLTETMFRVNLGGTVNLMSALKGIDCEVVINTGTCEEYGNNKAPFRETDLPMPVSPYSASKVAATFYCQMLYSSFHMPVVTLRPFLTYGPNQSGELLIPSLIRAALQGKDFEITKGEQTREFNYVSDVIEGYIKAASTPAAIGRVINIGCGKEYKIKDMAKKVIAMSGASINLKIGALPYREGEARSFYCDNSLARRILKWRPKVELEEGLRRTVEWYRQRFLKRTIDNI